MNLIPATLRSQRTLIRPLVALCLAAVALVGVTGCGSSFEMMPAPLMYKVTAFDLFQDLQPEEKTNVFEVLYATDRKPGEESSDAGAVYTDERGISLRFGQATVMMGRESTLWPELERDSLSVRKRPPMRLAEVTELGELWTTIPFSEKEEYADARRSNSHGDAIRKPAEAFAAEVNRRLEKTEKKSVVVYVPGFNTSFETPIMMMAQFGHFMQNHAVFVAFSWPSSASPLGYSKQVNRRAVSNRNLRELLTFLAEETEARDIHIVTYSAGAPVVTEALLQLRLQHAETEPSQVREKLKIGNVIYSGADQDMDYFRNVYLDGFDDVADSITVYASQIDSGLGLSSKFMNGLPRLGRSLEHLTEGDLEALRRARATDLVNVTSAQEYAGKGDALAHAYWYLNSWVNTDVIAILSGRLSPEDRGLVWDEEAAQWVFPEDYPDRIARIIEGLVESRKP